MRRILITFVLLSTISTLFYACDDTSSGEGGSSALLPQARGALGELILVMDTAQLNRELGTALREVFNEEVPGLPAPENYFTVRRVTPVAMNSTLKAAHTLVYVATLDNDSPYGREMLAYFTENSLQMIKEDPNLYYFIARDRYARGQFVLYLFGQTERVLFQKLRDNSEAVRNLLIKNTREKLAADLYKSGEVTGISNKLKNERGYTIKVPFAWDLAKEEENFVWLRRLDQTIDKSVWIYSTDYVDESQFSQQSILALRLQAAKDHLFDIEVPEVYMESQDQENLPVETVSKEINLNGQYALETRGLWRLSDYSRGGPFISYTVADASSGKLYYIEGYVDSPGKDKLPSILELEAILRTFEIPQPETQP